MSETLQAYLLERLPDYVRKLCIDNGEPESYESSLSTYERELIYGDEDIVLAYYMDIPRSVLHRFGYTDDDIDEKMEEVFTYTEYPR